MHCSLKLKCELESLSRTRAITANDLRADEGRETKALNCKPNTNLKEISELSNYYKTSGFRLHAVIFSALHSLHQNTMHAIHASRGGVWWGKQNDCHIMVFTQCLSKR
jgi:hypothetical protein